MVGLDSSFGLCHSGLVGGSLVGHSELVIPGCGPTAHRSVRPRGRGIQARGARIRSGRGRHRGCRSHLRSHPRPLPQSRSAALIDHLRHYRGKRLRPALLLLTAKACRQGYGRPPHARGGGRDDPHRDARPRRRARRGRTSPPLAHGQRRLGQQGQHPAGRHALHPCLPPDEHGRSAAPAN